MAGDSNPQRFVKMLIGMQQKSQEKSKTSVCVADPESHFRPWVYRLVRKHYYPDTMRSMGWELEDFSEECISILFDWIYRHPEWLAQMKMNDRILAAFIKKIARNLKADIWRKRKNHTFASLIQNSGNCNEDSDFEFYENIPDEIHERPDCEADFENEQARFIMAKFVVTLQHEPKELATFNAMLYFYNENEILNVAVSRYWLVYQLLKRKKQHLPKELRDYLKQSFPDEKFSNISQRITILKNKLAGFLKNNPSLSGID